MDWPRMLQRNKSVPLIHDIRMTSFVTSGMLAVVVSISSWSVPSYLQTPKGFQATRNERASLSNMIEIAVGMKVKATFNVQRRNRSGHCKWGKRITQCIAHMYFSCYNKNLLQLFGSFAHSYCCGDLVHVSSLLHRFLDPLNARC